jgi:integrase
MPTLKMTDAAVQRVSATPGERTDYFDAHPRDRQRGLVLRVSAGAEGSISRTWSALFRIKGSEKLRRATIGDYPTYSLAQAREEAAQYVQSARRGVDLARDREASARLRAAKEKDTIEAVVKSFLEHWAKKPKRKGGMRAESYVNTLRQHFDNRVLPAWRGRNIADIRRSDVNALVEKIAEEDKRPVLANRVLAAVKAMFNYCLKQENPFVADNPAKLVERPGVETARERALSSDELQFIWPAFENLGYPFGPCLKLTLLTGQRRDEVSGLRWSEIDEKAKTWLLPAHRNKGRRDHLIPLSDEAVKIIEGLKATKRKDVDFVFTTNEKSAISGFSKAKRLLDEAVTEARKKKELPPLPRWTIHDLRRTAATEMSRLKVSRFVIARILNHKDASITGIYDKHDFLEEKKTALAQWAHYLLSVVAPQSGKVASLTARRAKAGARA